MIRVSFDDVPLYNLNDSCSEYLPYCLMRIASILFAEHAERPMSITNLYTFIHCCIKNEKMNNLISTNFTCMTLLEVKSVIVPSSLFITTLFYYQNDSLTFYQLKSNFHQHSIFTG